jgi:D-tyrosyl-tRNA(Tyr) deacylase
VAVDGRVVGRIGTGYCLLVGFTGTDTPAECDWMAGKIIGLRLFADEAGKMNRDVTEVDGEVLVVSQFTLYGDARKGRRPSFISAARPEVAIPLYQYLLEAFRTRGVAAASGEFGAMMDVEIHNDGPVTLLLERDHGA